MPIFSNNAIEADYRKLCEQLNKIKNDCADLYNMLSPIDGDNIEILNDALAFLCLAVARYKSQYSHDLIITSLIELLKAQQGSSTC